MTKDDHSEDTGLSQENGGDQSVAEDQTGTQHQQGTQQEHQQDESQEDYRAKLNATNRFLESQGFVFNKDKKRWEKPSDNSQSGSVSEQQQEQQSATPAALSRDEAKLIAKGFSDDEIEHAKKVAALQGVTLSEAVNDDLFKGWKDRKDKELKQREAQLGTARGGRSSSKKTLATKGLSAEDHRELTREKFGI